MPRPRNMYGATKCAAEDLCELIHRDHGLPVLILRTSRFFPEADDREDVRTAYADLNLKVNELLYRRVDLEDAVDAHLDALDRAPALGFGRYIISATTPFTREDSPPCAAMRRRSSRAHFPEYEERLRRARLDDVPDDRARLRQRPRPPRPRLGAALRLRLTRSSASPAARTRAATSPSRSARRATTPSRRASTRREAARRSPVRPYGACAVPFCPGSRPLGVRAGPRSRRREGLRP